MHLMSTMLRYNISANLIRGIKQLYDKAISEVKLRWIASQKNGY